MARKRKILVIEDNETLRDSLRRAFGKKGYEVVATSSAEEGLGIVLGHLFDLILVDLKLPRNDGDSFIRQVRALGCRSEIVMMTGYGDPDLVAAMAKIGARATVIKEADFLDKILATVHEVLSSPQHLAETA